MKRRIAIVTDDPGWHGARLKAAFAARGCDSSLLSLQACGLDLSSESGLSLPGFDRLPDGVFVRGVPGGSLEQVVLYLDVLHLLKRLGVTVYNDARAIELSVDKGMSSCLLHAAGIPTPAAWVMSQEPAARRLLQRELEVYARAEKFMVSNSPGFPAVWEEAKRSAITGLQEEETGKSLPKRVFNALLNRPTMKGSNSDTVDGAA